MSRLPRNVFTTCPKEEASRVVVPQNEFKIFSEKDGLTTLMIVKGEITYEDIGKAVKCAKLTSFYVTKVGSSTPLTLGNLPIKENVVIRDSKNMPVPSAEKEYKIFDGVSGRELMIVKGAITIADTQKAVKCAGIDKFEAYTTKVGSVKKLTGADYPAKFDINVWQNKKPLVKRTPEVFHVCESTSIAPTRKPVKKVVPETPVKVSAKRKFIKAAIKGLQAAIDSLSELEKII